MFPAFPAPVVQENSRRPSIRSAGGSGRFARRCNAVLLSPPTRLTSSIRYHGSTTVFAKAAAPSSSAAEAAGRREASASAAVPASDRKHQRKQVLSSNVVPLRSTSPMSGERTRSAWVPPAAPILSGGGGGVFFFWQLGKHQNGAFFGRQNAQKRSAKRRKIGIQKRGALSFSSSTGRRLLTSEHNKIETFRPSSACSSLWPSRCLFDLRI